jgi:hypothetical protein
MDHAHAFVIASPAGPTSLGVCACGEAREYPNAMPQRPWAGAKFLYGREARESLEEQGERLTDALEAAGDGARG